MLSGCGGDNDSSQSVLVGVWMTEACDQATDSNGALINIWGKGLYEFTTTETITVDQVTFSSQGTIRLGQLMYSDSNCVTATDTNVPAEIDPPVLYADGGQELLQEGIPGNKLIISLTAPNSIQRVSGFYTLDTGSLCFSEYFAFEPFSFDVSPMGPTGIDFENCLVKADSP